MRLKLEYLTSGLFLFATLCVFLWVLYRTAWLCDDAYITFRTVDHFLNGEGMRWNVGERVQSFTHPLWFFLLSAGSWFTGELYYTSLFLSIFLTLLMLAGIGLTAHREPCKVVPLQAVLLFSRAFIDYSTSGLENPLSHFMLLVFLSLCWQVSRGYLWVFAVSLTAALGMLNRLDLGLLFFPCMVHIGCRYHDRRTFAMLILGMGPLFVWLVFSLFYYGFLFPNTAYAKLGTGIPTAELCIQGLRYLQNSLTRDPVTLVVIVTALAFSFLPGQRKHLPAAVGLALYLVYTVRIGGDFMSGRFLTPPLLFAVVMLTRTSMRIGPKTATGLTLAVVLIGVATPRPSLLSGPQYGKDHHGILDAFLIADERAFYYQKTGLAAPETSKSGSIRPIVGKRRSFPDVDATSVIERDTVGLSGYLAGREVHIIDVYALGDPLLARLPALYAPRFRIGHFRRHVPEGYKETLITGKNVIEDSCLAAYYDHLSLVIQGPLFSLERLKTILSFQWGAYDHLIERERYRFPGLCRVFLCAEACGSKTPVLAEPAEFEKGGIELSWESCRHDAEVGLEIEGGSYYLLFMKGNEITGILPEMPSSVFDIKGLEPGNICLEVPGTALSTGYNALRIMPMNSSCTYRVLSLQLGMEKSVKNGP